MRAVSQLSLKNETLYKKFEIKIIVISLTGYMNDEDENFSVLRRKKWSKRTVLKTSNTCITLHSLLSAVLLSISSLLVQL